MSSAIKIRDTEMQHIREAAELQSRSLAGQAEHWIRLGRSFEKSSEVTFSRVDQALRRLISSDALNEEEFDVYLDRMASEPTQEEALFFAKMRATGFGVGLDDDNNLIYQEKV
jgi:ParD-like antitoxin of type II bacterial toxin-antitoxin system